MSDDYNVQEPTEFELTNDVRKPHVVGTLVWSLKLLLKTVLIVGITFIAFKSGQMVEEFEKKHVDLNRVCSHCIPVGDTYPDSLEIGRSEYRVTCDVDDDKRISVLAR